MRLVSKQKPTKLFGVELPVVEWAKEEGIADEEIRERILTAVNARYAERAEKFGTEIIRYLEKAILLQTLDQDWREHIINLEHLRQYVGLRGYGQRDPLNEYKSEALTLFENLLLRLRTDVVRQLHACPGPHGRAATGPGTAASRAWRRTISIR